jgi:putative ABC transport system ATP-binding protein
MEIMKIDDLITLKLFDKALKEINQLEKYDFHKYKTKFYMAQLHFEESVSHAIEMWKLCDNPFQKLEYYLFRAIIFHRSHKKDRVQEFLQKFEKDINMLYTKESTPYTYLLIQYQELKIELNVKDHDRRRYYIDNLFLKAPEIVKYQYELLELSYQEDEEIRKNLYPLIEKYAALDLKPLDRALKLRDLLSSLFLTIGEVESAKIQLEGAIELIGEGIPDIRKSLEIRLSSLSNTSKKPENLIFVDANLTLHSSKREPRIKIYNAIIERNETSYIITVKGKTTTYSKRGWYLSAQGGRSINKSDWEREQRQKTKFVSPIRKNQQSFVQAKLIEGNVEGNISIGRGELVTLRGPTGSGKSEVTNYLIGVEHPEKGEILIDGTLLSELEGEVMEEFRNSNMAVIVEGRVVLPKNITKDSSNKIDIDNFIDDHPKEVISAINDLKNLMTPVNNFFYHLITIFKLKPKLILMNEPFMNLRGQLLINWLKVLSMLVKHHEIAILLETHHAISSFYADCQYFIRDHKIVEIIEKV